MGIRAGWAGLTARSIPPTSRGRWMRRRVPYRDPGASPGAGQFRVVACRGDSGIDTNRAGL